MLAQSETQSEVTSHCLPPLTAAGMQGALAVFSLPGVWALQIPFLFFPQEE